MRATAYAEAGVDYSKIDPFKELMVDIAKMSAHFPNAREVFVRSHMLHAHGGVYEYRGTHPHLWCQTTEGLGNKNWVAEWMYEHTSKSYYDAIAVDTVMMAVNDCIAQGAMPVAYTDEVAAGDSDWYMDMRRSEDFAKGMLDACRMAGMALVAGESPALKYLVNAVPPVKSAPSLSGTVVGIIAPAKRLIDGRKLGPGDQIIGLSSSGIHANGISLAIEKALELEEKFLTKLSNGRTLGEEILTPTRCYVGLIERLLEDEVDIHALLPGTGGGVAKIAFDPRPYTYHINGSRWPLVLPIFHFLQQQGVNLLDCLTTFNCGIGYYVFVPETEVVRVLQLARITGYEAFHIGYVEEGKRETHFHTGDSFWRLLPPGK